MIYLNIDFALGKIMSEYDLDIVDGQNSGNYYRGFGRIELMQYTGLKDWYEGDILRAPHFIDNKGKQHFLYHEIKWDNEHLCWKAVSINNPEGESIKAHGNPQLWVYAKNEGAAEIIGNIYESKHLLDSTVK